MNDLLKVGVSKLPLSCIRIYCFLDNIVYIDQDGGSILNMPYQVFNDNFHQFCESVKEFQYVEFDTCLNEKNEKMELFLHRFGLAISAFNYDELYYEPDDDSCRWITVRKLFDQLLTDIEQIYLNQKYNYETNKRKNCFSEL